MFTQAKLKKNAGIDKVKCSSVFSAREVLERPTDDHCN